MNLEMFKNFVKPEVFFANPLVMIIIQLLLLIVVLKIVHVILKTIRKSIVAKISDREQAKQVRTITMVFKSFLDIVITAIFVMELFTRLGIDIRPILTAAGVLGVAVGFGAKRFVEDIISGIILILEGQIRVGDFIEIGTHSGTVEQLNLKMITLRDANGRVHYIRNGMVDIVTNYTREYAYAVIELGVAYKENADYVMKTIIDIVENELKKGCCADFVIGNIEMQGVASFGDSAVNYRFRIKTKPIYQWDVQREFNRLIKNKFDELGIEIPFPQRTLHIQKEENV